MVKMERIKVFGAFLPSSFAKVYKEQELAAAWLWFWAAQPGPWWSHGSAWLW